MKYKLSLLEPVGSANRFGEETFEYRQFRIVNAERVKMSGRRSEEVGEHFPDYRVKQLGGYEYTVTNVIPNIDRGMNTLICERVNL